MKQYIELGKKLLEQHAMRPDRTGTGTVGIFGYQMRFNLQEGFPLLTTKKVHLKSIIHELLWFLRGSTNNNELTAEGVKIWTPWAADDGSIGPLYGSTWRSWEDTRILPNDTKVVNSYLDDGYSFHAMAGGLEEATIVTKNHDQIATLIDGLKNKPFSRRHVISAWNVANLPDESISPQENVKNGKMALAPCHAMFQFYTEDLSIRERSELNAVHGKEAVSEFTDHVIEVRGYMGEMKPMDADVQAKHHAYFNSKGIPSRKLSYQLYQRSADYPVGVPLNIASYALLTMMIAQCVDMVPGEFIHTFGDVHLYADQTEKFKEQMEREPYPLPKMVINPEVKNIDDFKFDDFKLEGYQSHPGIVYPISV